MAALAQIVSSNHVAQPEPPLYKIRIVYAVADGLLEAGPYSVEVDVDPGEPSVQLRARVADAVQQDALNNGWTIGTFLPAGRNILFPDLTWAS